MTFVRYSLLQACLAVALCHLASMVSHLGEALLQSCLGHLARQESVLHYAASMLHTVVQVHVLKYAGVCFAFILRLVMLLLIVLL